MDIQYIAAMDSNANSVNLTAPEVEVMPEDLRRGDLLWCGERWGWRALAGALDDGEVVEVMLVRGEGGSELPADVQHQALPARRPVLIRRPPRDTDPLTEARHGWGQRWVDGFVNELRRAGALADAERQAAHAELAYCRTMARQYKPEVAAHIYLRQPETPWVQAVLGMPAPAP
jgi:hypothetical protein